MTYFLRFLILKNKINSNEIGKENIDFFVSGLSHWLFDGMANV